MTKIIILILLITSIASQHYSYADVQIDRYTTLKSVETQAQADILNVNVSIVFPKNITKVASAIDYMLKRSGYSLHKNSEFERLNTLTLPEVHRKIGVMPLHRAIKVLLGKTAQVKIDETHRIISIVKNKSIEAEIKQISIGIGNNKNSGFKRIIKKQVSKLNQVELVHIKNKSLEFALKTILPNGWRVIFEDKYVDMQTTNVVSEDKTRKQVIQKILEKAKLSGYFYPKLKILVVTNTSRRM